MFKSIFVAVFMVCATSAFAGQLSPEKKISSEVIIRQVLAKDLLKSDEFGKEQIKMLEAMINRQVKAPYTSIEVTNMVCDYVLGGRDQCSIGVLDATNDGTESLIEINVIIEKGEVTSASASLVAG